MCVMHSHMEVRVVPEVKSRHDDECISGRKASIQVRSGSRQRWCARAVASTKMSAARRNLLLQSGVICAIKHGVARHVLYVVTVM
jgi:hypothetical protein